MVTKKNKPVVPKAIPITILTGFLGAGKTSVLNHILHAEHGMRIAVLVNDFGALNIDAELIVGVEGESIKLSNGCICCTIRDDLMVETLNLLTQSQPPEYIIIETSGVSDPVAVAMTFREMEFIKAIELDSILTVIDAEQFEDVANDYQGLAIDQIGAADIIILNKVDLVDSAYIEHLKTNVIRRIAKQARIIEANFGKVPLELVIGVGQYDPQKLADKPRKDIHVHEQQDDGSHTHDHAHHHDDHDHTLVFDSWSWQGTQPLSFDRLSHALKNLPRSIYRAKGIIQLAETPHKRLIAQVAGKRITMYGADEGWGQQTPKSNLVFIGEQGGIDTDILQVVFDQCQVTDINATPFTLPELIEEKRES